MLSVIRIEESMKDYNGNGQYTVKATGEVVSYEYDYTQMTSIDDIEEYGTDKALSLINRMLKVDSNNQSREKAKVANGHSTAKVLTEDEKLERKEGRAKDRELLKKLKADPSLLASLGIDLG